MICFNTLQLAVEQVLANQTEHSQILNTIENKIDDIKTVLLKLSSDFKDIKNLPREIEEKITRLNKELENQIFISLT